MTSNQITPKEKEIILLGLGLMIWFFFFTGMYLSIEQALIHRASGGVPPFPESRWDRNLSASLIFTSMFFSGWAKYLLEFSPHKALTRVIFPAVLTYWYMMWPQLTDWIIVNYF